MKSKSMLPALLVLIVSQSSFAYQIDECNPPPGMTLIHRPAECGPLPGGALHTEPTQTDGGDPAPETAETTETTVEDSAFNPEGGGKYRNAGRSGEMSDFRNQAACLPEIQRQISARDCVPTTACTANTPDCQLGSDTSITRFKDVTEEVDFQSVRSCQSYFVGSGASESESGGLSVTFNLANPTTQLKAKVCRLVASGCELTETVTASNKSQLQTVYNQCVAVKASKQLRAVVVGMQKCTAIKSAGKGTTDFAGDGRVSSIDGKITCKRHEGLAFDYPSCKSFITWYNTLTAAQTGVQMYNEGDKITTGMRAQNDAATAIASGNGQEAGIEASRKTIMASASAEERNKMFFLAKGAAITSQLMSFVTAENIEGQCDENAGCCKLFEIESSDGIRPSSQFFPNGGEKDKMIAEVIKAGGEAALAAMKEQELKRQAAALKAIKDQMTAPEDTVDEGLMRFCLQFPQDSKCLGAGNRVISGGSGFKGPSFSGQNMGLGNLGTAASEDIAVEDGAASAIGGAQNSVGNIGSADKGAADAKATFDAPSALKGGGGAPTISGGGGGVGASASANGLSNDPGVEGDKKETPLKMTSKSASYEGGAGYNGGGYRAGAGDKKDAAGNPFASMFGKDKGRSPSAVPEIDSPASDLFTKISNRYGEVQKRKALMDVR